MIYSAVGTWILEETLYSFAHYYITMLLWRVVTIFAETNQLLRRLKQGTVSLVVEIVLINVCYIGILEFILKCMVFLKQVAVLNAWCFKVVALLMLQITWSASLRWLHHRFSLITWRQLVECKWRKWRRRVVLKVLRRWGFLYLWNLVEFYQRKLTFLLLLIRTLSDISYLFLK